MLNMAFQPTYEVMEFVTHFTREKIPLGIQTLMV